jgi:hypothetical protein
MIQEFQKGQILLIVVLVMVTVLTVGLSVAVRSITNERTSEEATNSEQAFSAAEAGIEQSLTSDTAMTGTLSNNATYKTAIIKVSGAQFALNNDSPILTDESSDIWLSTYPGYTNPWSGTFNIYWGKSTDTCNTNESLNTMAALEVIILSGTPANPQMTRYLYDPCSSRQTSNNFTYVPAGTYSVSGGNYAYSTPTITVNAGIYARVIPLYAPSIVAIQNCGCNGGMPIQGTVIQSVGTSSNTEREIQTYRYYPQLPPEIFQYNLFVPQ